jgi:glycosyltransferase involved in cell wall biosynthesis
MTRNTAILALIPAWNEGSRLGPVVEATRHHLPVVVVDDGSQDDTVAVAKRAGATVVSHPRNRGKGVSLTTGFAWALERGYDAVLTLDADGQHDPDDIPKFLIAQQTGRWDLIIGRRRFDQMPFPRGYTNPFGSWLLSLALRERIPDNQSGFRLHHRRLLEGLDLTTTGFELEVEIIIQAICQGMRIGWVEIRTIYGDEPSYFHPLRDSARFLGMVWHAWRRRRAVVIRRSEDGI